jgi:hypothetical protein
MRAAIWVLLATFLAGCRGGSSSAPAVAPPAAITECAQRLGPRSARIPPPQPSSAAATTEAPPSRLIVHAQLPLATLAAELERHVAPRLAEGTGVRIGPAGVLEYSVDRGAFTLSIEGDHLRVEAPVEGRARACRGGRCYAGCEPRALVRAEMPLWLRPDYRFGPSRLGLQFTNGCKVSALGGLLQVDVTPLLESALAPQLERVRRQIDQRLPDVRLRVEQAWRQLSTPRPLPLGGCLILEPLGLVQGPVEPSLATAHARFALLARPELRTDCRDEAPPVPLPPLSADPALPDEGSLTLGMELPLASLARAFETATPDAGAGPRVRVERAALEARGKNVAAELELGGHLCGPVELEAEPTFAGEGGLIELTAGKLDARESARVRAAGVDPEALARQLTRSARVSAPYPLPLLRAAPPALAGLFSDPTFSLSARVSSLRAAGAAARERYLVAWVEARGSLWLEQK